MAADLLFSDDEDGENYSNKLDEVHAICFNSKPSILTDRNENSSVEVNPFKLSEDSIFEELLQNKRKPLEDVFLLSVAPPKDFFDPYNENELSSGLQELDLGNSHTPKTPKTRRKRTQHRKRVLVGSPTPRRARRTILASIAAQMNNGDDSDDDFIPPSTKRHRLDEIVNSDAEASPPRTRLRSRRATCASHTPSPIDTTKDDDIIIDLDLSDPEVDENKFSMEVTPKKTQETLPKLDESNVSTPRCKSERYKIKMVGRKVVLCSDSDDDSDSSP